MLYSKNSIKEIIEKEEPKFDNAWEHALYHLNIGSGVLFEEFEGRNHKNLYDELIQIINKIESEYIGYRKDNITITGDQYRELKSLYVNDETAIKFPFPIRVVSNYLPEDTVVVRKMNEVSPYLIKKLPWLSDI